MNFYAVLWCVMGISPVISSWHEGQYNSFGCCCESSLFASHLHLDFMNMILKIQSIVQIHSSRTFLKLGLQLSIVIIITVSSTKCPKLELKTINSHLQKKSYLRIWKQQKCLLFSLGPLFKLKYVLLPKNSAKMQHCRFSNAKRCTFVLHCAFKRR